MIVAPFLAFNCSLFCSQLNDRKQEFVSLTNGLKPLMTIESVAFMMIPFGPFRDALPRCGH
jgi:hypothetical protein